MEIMWKKMDYGFQVKNHYTTEDLLMELELYISENYQKKPIKCSEIKELHLDPGGMIFMRSEFLKTTIDGFSISVRPELLLTTIYVWAKRIKKIKEKGIVKIYFNNFDVIVLPESLYYKIGAWLTSQKSAAYIARQEMENALSGHPNFLIQKSKNNGDA
jgi:hypothetical protein